MLVCGGKSHNLGELLLMQDQHFDLYSVTLMMDVLDLSIFLAYNRKGTEKRDFTMDADFWHFLPLQIFFTSLFSKSKRAQLSYLSVIVLCDEINR